MNLTVDRQSLRSALARVKPAVMRSGPNPALAGVLLEADGTTLRITASNIDTTITTTLTAMGEAGRVLVYHEPLDRLASNTSGDTLDLSVEEDDMLQVKAGRAKANLRCLDADTFPRFARLDGANEAKLDEDWAAIQRVAPFRSTETTRPILTGIHLGGGVAECTDSYRLARHAIGTDAELLLSPDAITAAARVCPDGIVTLRWKQQRYELEADGTIWAGQCLEGKFPPVTSLIPVDPQLSLTVDKADLIAAIRTVVSIGDDTNVANDGKIARTNVVHIQQVDGADEIVLSRRAQDVGDAEVAIPATAVGDCTYAFAGGFLLPLLAAVTDDTVTLQGVDGLKPWVLREGDFLGLLMPVRVS